MKNVLAIYSPEHPHWVGNGFPVRTLISYQQHGKQLSPFLLLDYAGPEHFEASAQPRGVGLHPHRGFETVTIVYQGEVAHRDSTGQNGVIGPGDVQWMTAGAGILHEEFHSPAFTQSGGKLEMVQLWVNLPAKDKMTAPRYQAIPSQDIPCVNLPAHAGTLRVIAGEYREYHGPARTHSPMQVWDMRLAPGGITGITIPLGWNAALAVLHGTVVLNGDSAVHDAQLAVFDPTKQQITIEANAETVALFLSGEPLDEPIVGHGPFVMNSQEEIIQALADFDNGRFAPT